MKVNQFKRFPIKKGFVPGIIFSAVLLFFSCNLHSSGIQFADDFRITNESVCLAVMNFDYNGYGLSSKLALNAADNLTSELFIRKKVDIIDRNLVRDILKKDDTIKRDQYSRNDIKRIGTHLNATHIIFGSLYSSVTPEEYYESEKYRVDLTLRIVAVDSGNVVGVIKQNASHENIEVLLDKLVKKVVNSI